MSGKSNFLELELLDHVFGGADWARPATVYIALYTTAPGDAGGGVEVSGGSYARLAVTNNATNFPAAAGDGAKANGTVFTFAQATADWGLVAAFAIFDAIAGNMLYWGLVTPNRSVPNGAVASFAVGELDITED